MRFVFSACLARYRRRSGFRVLADSRRPRLAGADTHRSGGDQPEDTSKVSPIGENHQRFPNSVPGTVLCGGDGTPPSSGEERRLALFSDTRRAPQVGAPTGMLAHLDALTSTDGESESAAGSPAWENAHPRNPWFINLSLRLRRCRAGHSAPNGFVQGQNFTRAWSPRKWALSRRPLR